jgi:hypothetical protein
MNGAWVILKSHYMTTWNEQDFRRQYEMIHSIGRKEINKLAEKRARDYIERQKAEDYIPIFENGGLYYFNINKYEDLR